MSNEPSSERLQELAVLVALALEVRPLRELSGWEPVGTLLESLHGSIAGHDGVTSNDIVRLRAMTRIWVSLHPRLRDFYSIATSSSPPDHYGQQKAIDSALWYVLGGAHGRAKLSPTMYALLGGVWMDRYGSPPPMELAPRIFQNSL